MVAFCFDLSGMRLTHLCHLVAIIILHVNQLNIQVYLRTHRTALRKVSQLVVLALRKVMRSWELRCRTLRIKACEWELNLVRSHLATIVYHVIRCKRNVIR